MTSMTAGIYLLKVNDRNTRTRCEICSVVLVSLLLTLIILHTLFLCIYCYLCTCNCGLGKSSAILYNFPFLDVIFLTICQKNYFCEENKKFKVCIQQNVGIIDANIDSKAEILLEDFEKRITEISSGKKVYIKNFQKQSHKVC